MTSSEILETLKNLHYPQHLEISIKIYWSLYPKQMEEIDSLLQEEISNRKKIILAESKN